MGHLDKVGTRRGACHGPRKGAARGHDQLDCVADDDGVVLDVSILPMLQHRALDKLAVAMAVASIGVLPCATDFHSPLVPSPALCQIPKAPLGLVYKREAVEGTNHPPLTRVHNTLRVVALTCHSSQLLSG